MFTRRERRRLTLVTAGVVAVSAGLGVVTSSADGARASGERTTTTAAPLADVRGAHPSVSDDGRWIVHAGLPTDGSERGRTVWLRDTAAPGQADVELTTVPADVRPGDSVLPAISGDGCSVAVITQMAYDLFRDDDTGDRWDVYRLVLPHCGGSPGDWELVSTRSSAEGDTSALDRVVPDRAPAVSETGSIVAFTYQAKARSEVQAVMVVDLTVPVGAEGRSTQVAGTPSLAPNTTFRYRGQREASVSGDGRYVAFTSDARSADAVPEWGEGPVPGEFATSQVYVWDRMAPVEVPSPVTLVSQVQGRGAELGAGSPVLSGDGRFVAFTSPSRDLAGEAVLPECTTTCPAQVYRFDLAEGGLALVSRQNTSDGATQVAADMGGSHPSISDDGSQIAFVTRARNLFPTQTAASVEPHDGDIVVSEVDLGVVRRVTAADGVSPVAAVHSHPALSGPGRLLVFDTLAGPAVTGDEATGGGRTVVAVHRDPVLSAPALDMGTIAVGLPGDEWFVAVKNMGPSSWVPSSATTTDGFTVTGGTCQLGLAVAPGQTCTVQVVLTPPDIGPVTGELVIGEDLPRPVELTVPLAGAGGEPTLFPHRSGIDFPTTGVGRSSLEISADIGNIGFLPAEVAAVTVAGQHKDDFVVGDDSCTRRTLGPQRTCSISVSFAPTDAGYRTGLVIVTTTTGQYTAVVVNGVGTRDAVLDAPVTKLRAGGDIPLGGQGFTPGAVVNIAWADGRGASLSVTAAKDGSFLVVLPTTANERPGVRQIVAQSADQVATAEIQITRRPTSD